MVNCRKQCLSHRLCVQSMQNLHRPKNLEKMFASSVIYPWVAKFVFLVDDVKSKFCLSSEKFSKFQSKICFTHLP